MKQTIKVLPNSFFKDKENYWHLQRSVYELDYSSRELPDLFTLTIVNNHDPKTMGCVHIPDWHSITDEDSRSLRNFLKMNADDTAPMFQLRQYDLLQYISICMQFLDEDYNAYVKKWCAQQLQ